MTEPATASACAALSPEGLRAWLSELSDETARRLLYDWSFWARREQCAPAGGWFCWLVMAGRGFGKTRTGAEWVRGLVEAASPLTAPASAPAHIALVADTFADARDVMVEGESGILACTPKEYRPSFEPSRRRLVWPNGATAYLYAAADPEQLRGPQHHAAWADEIAKWPDGERAWSNLVLGLRLGRRPRAVATTTPRALSWLRRLAEEPSTVVTRGRTGDNRPHLPAPFLREVERLFAGTRLGAQELDGRLLSEVDGALWTGAMLESLRASPPAPARLERVVIAVDPPAGHGAEAAACGIVAAGQDGAGTVYVLEDASCKGLRPAGWAERVAAVFRRHKADRVIGEVNNGGDMVESVLRQVAPELPFFAVRASRGKIARAEPVAALYERGLVRHAGVFETLEEEMCSYTGAPGATSPDRLDALVWAVSELALRPVLAPSLKRL